MQVKVQKLKNFDGLDLPEYKTTGSAGLDLLAAIDHKQVLTPGQFKLIPTGIAIALPQGFEAQVRPRSGLAVKNGITVLNTPGTVDSDYRGELKVVLINLGEHDFIISRGMRIAQMVIARHEQISWQPVSELDSTERGQGGFGSTGA